MTPSTSFEQLETPPDVFFAHFNAHWLNEGHEVIDHANRLFKNMRQVGSDIYYLQNLSEMRTPRWFVFGMPTELIHADAGIHEKRSDTSRTVLAGGYLRTSLSAAMRELIRLHFEEATSNAVFTIDVPMQTSFEKGINFQHWFGDNYWPPEYMTLRQAYDQLIQAVGEPAARKQFAAFSHPAFYDLDRNLLNKRYKLVVYIDGRPIDTFGGGSRVTHLKFWSHLDSFHAQVQFTAKQVSTIAQR